MIARELSKRAVSALVVVFLASIVVFIGVRAIPGSPETALGAGSDPAAFAAIREKYGLDDPVVVQYVTWIGHALRGDLGTDNRGLPVTDTILSRLPITLELALLATLVSMVVGIGAGIVAAWWRGTTADYAATLFALVGLSVPTFWVGLLAIIVFAANLGWLPASGSVSFFDDPVENLRHMVMPALVLGLALSAVVMRQMRSAMLDALSGDYVRTARAKGLPPRRVAHHAVRNSLITVTTVLGLELGALISGAAVTEQIFGISGFGQLTLSAIYQRDYALLQGTVLVTAAFYVLINLVVDVLYTVIDPRIRSGGGAPA